MPIILIFFGIVLLVSAYQHNTPALGGQLVSDAAGFAKWGAAIIAIGLLQYIPGAEKPARALMLLVALVIILKNGEGFFDQLGAGISAFQAAATGAASEKSQVSQAASATVTAEKAVTALSNSGGTAASTSGGGGGILSGISGLFS